MSERRATAPVVVALLLAAAAVSLPAARAIAPADPQQVPTYRTGTTTIEVDVIVRDKNRRFVSDLRLEDFEVIEDGTPQQVSVAYRVLGPTEPTQTGADLAVAILPPPPPQQVQRVIVFFFDQPHLQPGGFDRARKAAIEFMKKDFRQGDVGGVLNGGTMVNNRLSNSREELAAAIASVKPAPENAAMTRELRQWPRFVDLYEAWRVVRNEPAYEPGVRRVLDQVVRRACLDQPDACSGGGGGGASMIESEVQNKATQLVTQARILAKQTLDTVAGLANGLARIPGRKTVILLTEGFFVEDNWADLRGVVGRAARASVRIYAIDTRGLNRGSAGSDILSSANPSQPTLAAPSIGDIAADGPNSLAVDTGGYVIRNENDFTKALDEIDRDTSSYYVIGFRTNKPLDGKFHPIEVKVKRPGVTVRARTGYIATPEAAAAGENLAAKPVETAAAAAQPIEKEPDLATPPGPPVPATVLPASPAATGAVRLRPDMGRQVATLEPRSGAAVGTAPFPDALRKNLTQGWEAYQRGDLAAARSLLESAAAHPAVPVWGIYVLGWTENAASDLKLAAASWERVRTAVPEFHAVYFDLGDVYLQQREFGRSIEVLRQAVARWPKDVEGYNALGVVQLARGALDDAIETFGKGVGVAPNDATANYNLAKTCELRFIRTSRQRSSGASTFTASQPLQDRNRAVEHYRRTVELGGQFVEEAREGLKRLGVQSRSTNPGDALWHPRGSTL